jgi:hypothetical protein
MKRIIGLFLGLVFVTTIFSQEKADTTYWVKGGSFTANFSQVSFTNWSAGGLNAIAGVTKAQFFANFKKGNITWDNIIDLGYGLSKVDTLTLKKSEDIIDIQSKLGIKATEKLSYSGLLNFKSQFAPGYSDPYNQNEISNLFAPAYLTLAFGMDYKPNSKFSLVVAPVTGKMTFVNDSTLRINYGLDADKSTRMELGALLKAALNTEIIKNVGLLSELGLFTNYLNQPENIDVDWKVSVNMKINKFLSANINTHLIYDADIIDQVDNVAKVQFKELFGIGLSFKF